MPLLPTLSLLLSLLVCGAIFRLYAWRATLSLKALGLMFGLGAVGASVASLYLQNFGGFRASFHPRGSGCNAAA